MTKTKAFISLIRLPNLVVLFLTQSFFYFFILVESIPFYFLELDTIEFLLLSLASLLIAGGGNLLNDIYDSYTDHINKPHKKAISYFRESTLVRVYYALTAGAFAIGIYFIIVSGDFKIASVLVFAAGLLWFYNVSLKSVPFFGNFSVSLLCALSLILVFIAEESFFIPENYSDPGFSEVVERVIYLLAGYSAFAFLITFIRELVKDMQDRKGDFEAGYKTLAVLMGDSLKIVVLLLLIIAAGCLSFIVYQLKGIANYHALYIIVLLIFPVLIVCFLIIKAKDPKDYRLTGILLKLIMFFGILSMPVFHLLNKSV